MNSNFKLKLITATLMVVSSVSAHASLSGLNVNSYLGEPFSGSVVVSGPSAQEILNNKVAVQVDDARITTTVTKQGKDAVVNFRSSQPINDSILRFKLRASSESRTYTALLDPKNNGSVAKSGQKSKASPEVSGNKTQPTVKANQHFVQPKQTIYDIARIYKPKNLTLQQTARAIARANPKAFRNGNLDNLFAGVTLTIPTAKQMQALSAPVQKPAAARNTAPAAVPKAVVKDDAKETDNAAKPTQTEKVEDATEALPEEAVASDLLAASEEEVASEEIASEEMAASEEISEEEEEASAAKAAERERLRAEAEAARLALEAENETDWMAYAPYLGAGVVALLLLAYFLRRKRSELDDDDLPPPSDPSFDDEEETVDEQPKAKKSLFAALPFGRKKKEIVDDADSAEDDIDLIDDEFLEDITFDAVGEEQVVEDITLPDVESVADEIKKPARDLSSLLQKNAQKEPKEEALPSLDDLADFALPEEEAVAVTTTSAVEAADEDDFLDLDDLSFDLDEVSFDEPVAKEEPVSAVAKEVKEGDLDFSDFEISFDDSQKLDFSSQIAPDVETKPETVDTAIAEAPEPEKVVADTDSQQKKSMFAEIGDSDYTLDFDDSLTFDLDQIDLGEAIAAPEKIEPIFVDEREYTPTKPEKTPTHKLETAPLAKAKEAVVEQKSDLDLDFNDSISVEETSIAPVATPVVAEPESDDLSLDFDLDFGDAATIQVEDKVISEPKMNSLAAKLPESEAVDDLDFDLDFGDVASIQVEEKVIPEAKTNSVVEELPELDIAADDFDLSLDGDSSTLAPDLQVNLESDAAKVALTDDSKTVDLPLNEEGLQEFDLALDDLKNIDLEEVEDVASVEDDLDAPLPVDDAEAGSDGLTPGDISQEVIKETVDMALKAKIDLAETYLDMGDSEAAEEALEEVLEEAKDEAIIAKAKALMAKI